MLLPTGAHCRELYNDAAGDFAAHDLTVDVTPSVAAEVNECRGSSNTESVAAQETALRDPDINNAQTVASRSLVACAR